MEKKFYSQSTYYIKIFFIIATLAAAYACMALLSNKFARQLTIWFRTNLLAVEYIINALVLTITVIIVLLLLLRNKPKFVLSETKIKTNRFSLQYKNIKGYYPSKGASEPYLMTVDGKRYDLELSWFSKKDRLNIVETIKANIEATKTTNETNE